MNVMITGASGFLGSRLTQAFPSTSSIKLTVTARRPLPVDNGILVNVGQIDKFTDWSTALRNQNTIIHTAARTHIMNDSAENTLSEYRKVNVDGTLNLARQSAVTGVKRFIFISSIKVNGEQSAPGKPFNAKDEPKPKDSYGISKWEAEQGLQQIAKETDMEVVIIRPPLVYGPGVKGTFASLISLMGSGLPLPLGAIHNQRSMIALDNLVDLIITCIDHPDAANQVLLASDGQDLSTTDLLRGLARAMDRPSRLLPVPDVLLALGASVMRKRPITDRMLGSLQVDISNTRDLLNWSPPISVDEGLRRCFESQEVWS